MVTVSLKIDSDSRDGEVVYEMAEYILKKLGKKFNPSVQDTLATIALLQSSFYEATNTVYVSDKVRDAILRSAE